MEPKHANNILLIIFSISTLLTSSSMAIISPSPNKITAIFAFGDSTIDTGNNNFLPTNARSNFPPYGRDFPFQISTGRFSNGKLTIDFITSFLGLKPTLPAYFKVINDNELLTGASFASAGSGLDPLTAREVNVLNITTQLDLFDQALARIKRLVGEEKARFIVEKALFFFSSGSNDVISFYDLNSTRSQFTISSYHDFLLQNQEDAIKRLYNRGARRFAVTSMAAVGCLPLQITIKSNGTSPRMCVEQQNIDSAAFNEKLKLLVSRLETQVFENSKVAYYDGYNPLLDMIKNPTKYGYEETLKGCCGTGLFEQGITCNVNTPTCRDASKYVFWDAVHPSLKAYFLLANLATTTVIPHILGY